MLMLVGRFCAGDDGSNGRGETSATILRGGTQIRAAARDAFRPDRLARRPGRIMVRCWWPFVSGFGVPVIRVRRLCFRGACNSSTSLR